MSPLFLGVDLGTSSLKTLALDASTGQTVALAAAEYDILTPRPGWAEQNPDAWVEAFLLTLRQLFETGGISPRQIAGIGFSGQMHGLVCLNARGQPLRPAILWADQRSHPQVRRVYAERGIEGLRAATGNPLAAGFMLASLLWLQENEPEVFRQTAHVLLPKDYLRYRLTGQLGSEPSDASSTAAFHPASRAWNTPWLDSFGIPPGWFPPIQPSHAPAGGVCPAFARLSGLTVGAPVYFGASDQSAQALGNGVIRPGDISCTIGTGGQLLAPALAPLDDPQLRLHLFCHALPGVWHLEAATLAAGLSLKWLRDGFFEGRSYQQLVDEAATAPPGAEGLRYLPYLAGERTPIMDPLASGSFTGLTLRHGRAHLARAVLEGVVCSLRQGLDLMLELGAPVERVIASGGGAKHPLWLQLQADLFNRPIHTSAAPEAAARGAALLAAVGGGQFASFEAACQALSIWNAEIVEPSPANVRRYQAVYESYTALYPLLKPSYREPSGE